MVIVMAGRIPEDISTILQERPEEMDAFIREARNLSPEQLDGLTQQVRRLRKPKRRTAK